MSSSSVKKEELRTLYLEKRKQLPAAESEMKSRKIIRRLIDFPRFKAARHVHSYVSVANKNEVDTHDLIRYCLENGKTVSVPKMRSNLELEHHLITSLDDLEPNDWGIPEPKTSKAEKRYEFDVVIVPMVAGDRYKNRIGYGKGFYDRFLKGVTTPKIGLLFQCQLHSKRLPAERFDIALDVLITENEIIQ